LPAFRKKWLARHAYDVQFRESYLGSGAQARAIAGGFEADIAALSLEPDIETLRSAGLIKSDWKAGQNAGIVTRSIVVIGVRKGNPKGIHDWDDLARKGVEVLTPDVRSSGGAMWNVAAIYGAALRGQTHVKAADKQAAAQLVGAVLRNVKAFDRGARESLLNFERGLGDAIVTYENEILVGRGKGQDYDYILPKSTILIENPVAVVDAYAERHGTLALARSFVEFLSAPEAQRAFAQYGLRPVLPEVAGEVGARFPAVTDLFTIRDLGGWPAVQRAIFDPGAVYDRALVLARQDAP
jgi:sulfate/thiosulfate-binding protein